jgi:hypothetical protein
MPRSRSLLLALLLLAGGLLGCDTTATQPESQVAVQAYLQAEAPLDTVRLARTVGAGDTFDPRAAAVEGADVEVRRLDDDGAVSETTDYNEGSVPGVYVPAANSPPTVQPTATYQLRVETDDGTVVTSTTTVPDAIPLVDSTNTATVYQSPDQPSLTIEPPRPIGDDRQNVYVFTVTSLLDFKRTPNDSLEGELTPFYADQFDADEDSLTSFRISSSGLLNQGNFTENAGGTVTVDLPWLGVAFYGPNEVALNAVDDNYYDFLRSQSAQQGAFAPGEIPNVIEHVEGGTGIFGSYSRAAIDVQIRRPSAGGS